MQDVELKNNYAFTLVKLILFLFIFCFLLEFTSSFWREIRSREGFNINIFVFSGLCLFGCYHFLIDLNSYYRKIQRFFFRTPSVSYILPAILIILAVGYFIIPKVLNSHFNKGFFIFFGGFIFTAHMVFVAKETKGYTFSTLVNYLFIISILYILNLFLLGFYFKIAFNVHLGKILISGLNDGAMSIKGVFSQFLH